MFWVKTFILSLFLLTINFNQLMGQVTDSSFTFSKEEVIRLDSIMQHQEQTIQIQKEKIELLETQVMKYKMLNQQDSFHIDLLNKNVSLLNNRVNLYIDLTKELKPKWYNKPVVHFFLGAITVTTAAIVFDLVR